MSINCRVSFKNNALEVVDKNGQPSALYYDALALTGNEDKAIDLWYKAFSQEFTEQVRLNKDDVTLDEVLKFVSANSSFGKSLEPAEIRSIKDIMDKNSFETLSDLYRTLVDIFKPQGIIELDTVKAYQSGLFDLQGLSEINLNEIDDILDKVEGTLRVTDIYVAPSSDSSASFIDTSRKTILGTPEFISQEDIEQEIVNNVESTKDEKEISSYINSLPYSSFADRFNKEGSFRTTILNNISKYTKVNTLFIVDGRPTTKNLNYYKSLVNTIGSNNNTEGLIADFEFLSGIDEDVWSQNQDEIKEVLREIEQDQFTENGIDIFGLSKFSSNKFLVIDTLNSLGEMLNNTTNETILNFSEKFIKVVPQPVSTTSELLPESLEPYAENIFRVDSALNDSELFRQFGLLKVSDNIYHKVDLGSRSNLYEELYQQAKETGYPISINAEDKEASLRDLEQHVLLQDSNVEKDIREEYNLNKIIFNHPKIQDTNDYLQLSDITTDTEYLVRDFARDFNDYIVTEKQVDSQLYRDTLSKFRVSDSGVSLAVPIKSIEGLEFEKELTDYIRLKKDQSMKYLLPSRPTNLKSRVDLQAINNPASVLNYSRQYAFDNGLLVTEKVSDNYVNFFGNTYAKVAEDSTNSVFKVVPKNLDANYYVTNTDFITSEDKENATQVLNDAKFSFTNPTLSEQEFEKSIEDAGIKNKVKFSIFGPKGAARLDAKEESSRRLDNLKTAIEMLGGKTFDQLYPKQKKAIKLATEWELGVDNKWKYESITDSKATLNLGINSIEDLDKKKKLSEVLDYPELFDAYPQIKNLKISVSEKGGSTGEATFSPSKNEIIIGVSKYKLENHFKEKENLDEISYLREEVFEALKFMAEKALRIGLLEKSGMSFSDALDKVAVQFTYEEQDIHLGVLSEAGLRDNDKFYELLNTLVDGLSGDIQDSEFDDFDAKTLTSVLHEIQHWIQQKEGFARGGNAYIALRLATPEQKEELDLALAEVRKLQGSGIDFSNANPQEMEILLKPFDLEDTLYRSVAGEVEARNVEERLGLFDEARKGTLLEDTADMFPFRQKVYYSSLDLINTQYGEPIIDTAIEKLKQTGLASRVNLMSPDEIYERLTSLGVNLSSKKQISAYHVSSSKFDKFDPNYVGYSYGTKFGWGHYFTATQDVAEYFKDNRKVTLKVGGREITGMPASMYAIGILDNKDSKDEFIKNIKDFAPAALANDFFSKEDVENVDYLVEELNKGSKVEVNGRNLYKVSFDDSSFLTWDKPVSKEIITKLQGKTKANLSKVKSGEDLYTALENSVGHKKTSKILLENDILGMRYPLNKEPNDLVTTVGRDLNKEYGYVVYDENAITIEEVVKFQKQLSEGEAINKDELAQDYFTREADRLPLTLAIFNRPEFVKMQGKSVNKIAVLNSLNQSGIKQIEKDLVRSVIEDFYKDQPKVSYDELEATVRANIMPLEVLNTNSYANYGMDNLSNGDYGDANTIIFNSPIEHGITGHFKSSFTSNNREKLNYEPKQLNNNTWVAVQEGYENQANGNDIYQYVGTAGTKESVDRWIFEYEKASNNFPEVNTDINEEGLKFSMYTDIDAEYGIDNEVVEVSKNGFSLGEAFFDRGTTLTDDVKRRALEMVRRRNIIQDPNYKAELREINKGMFGHIRVWTDGDIYHVAELQSDYFQNNNARKKALDRNTEYAEAFADKSDTLMKLKEKRDSSIISLKENGYINVYDREGAKSKSEVFRPINSFGQEVGKRDGIEVVKFGLYYALSINGELKTGNVYRTEELAEEQIKNDSEKADNYKTIDETQPLTEDDMPEELKGAFNFVTKDFYTEEKSIEKQFNNTVESVIANLPLDEKQFIASQKEWEKRMVRESLRLASSSGASKLRLPTPHTLSVIEGYISGDGAPYEIISADDYNRLAPGDKIDYLGSSQTVISADRDSIEIVLTEDVIKYNIEDYVNDELNYFTNEVINSESGLDFETQYTEEEFNDADKHSSLDGVDLEDIAEEVEDGLYEISRDKLEQVVRDYWSIFYNEDNIDSILSDQGYSNINVNGNFVYFTTRDIDTETLSQPDEYSDSDKDTFSISDLSDTQQTVANKYVELAEILRKEVGEENVETVTDDQGYDWYETDVEDKYSNKAVIAFQQKLSEQGIKPIVNGFVYNNEVFLNKDTVTEETPIHEFNHLFTDWMKKNRPSLYNKGIELVKEELSKEDSDIASVINYVQQTQPDLTGEKLLEEILTELTGREGAALIESGKKSGILDWIRSLFKEIGNMLGILDATPEQIANMTTREFAKSSAVQLLKGEDILAKAMNLRDSISYASMFGSVYSPVNDTVDSVAEELRACN
jgi:hypothetical protein